MTLSFRTLSLVSFLVVALGAAWMCRYETTPNVSGLGFYKLDRWTGHVAMCVAGECL
jgi:hypothetical protein